MYICFLEIFSGPECFVLGGFEVNWGNKACKYVHKYFFVFLSIQFLSIVFPKHCKFTANHKLFDFHLFQTFPEGSGCWMRGGGLVLFIHGSISWVRLGLLCLTCSWVFSFCLRGRRVFHLRGSSFLSLDGRAIHSGDTQYQSLFGLLHPFLCPALLWLEGYAGWRFYYLTV